MLGQFFLVSLLSGDNAVLKWVGLALLLIEAIGKLLVLSKAGKPGWAMLIPIWGDLMFLEVAELPWWWILGLFVPGLSYLVEIMIGLCIAHNFDQGVPFGLGLAFLPYIFYPILGLGEYEWGGPGGYHGMGS